MMNIKHKTASIILITFLWGLLSSCNNQTEEIVEKQVIAIKESTHTTFQELGLGIGYVGIDTVTPEYEGKQVMCAQVFPSLHNEGKARPSILTHKGDRIVIDKYQVTILEIMDDAVKIEFKVLPTKDEN